MNTTTKKILFWAPRVLCVIFAMFLSMNALDVFSEGYSSRETILALLIHLIPTFIIVITLVIAWRRERVGGILFISLACFYLLMSRGKGWIITGPLFLVGFLFLFN